MKNPIGTQAQARKQLNRCVDLRGLPPAQARVEIAKDCLAAIQLGTLKESHGCYADAYMRALRVQGGSDVPMQLRDLLKRARPSTVSEEAPVSACGIGALFLAEIARNNDFKVYVGTPLDHQVGRATVATRLNLYFDPLQIDLIEAAYEGYPDDMECIILKYPRLSYKTVSELFQKSHRFGHHRGGRRTLKCLVAILNNIVENRGTFCP